MCTKRDVIVFLAGGEFFHTLSHIFIKYYITLPMPTKLMEITNSLNNAAIIINAIITIALVFWAMRLSKGEKGNDNVKFKQ
jgi:hypothetical protein